MGRTLRCAAPVALAALAMAACVPRRPAGEPVSDEETRRRLMVETQIRERGISNPAGLAAMMRARRHLFVPEPEQPNAYDDGPLPIGYGQTISQPYIVAYMSEALDATAGGRLAGICARGAHPAA